MKRRTILSALSLTSWGQPGWSQPASVGLTAESYPSRPVRLVLPFSPGGTTDIMARLMSARFQQEFGQPLVVDHKPGAGGMIATEAVARATPDGHTLLLGSSAQLALNPSLYATVRYDSVKDFTPVTLLGATPNVLLTHPSTPWKSLADVLTAAKSQPNHWSFASPGSGSTAHLAAELLKMQTGVDLVHVPYRGAGPAVTDALGGQVPLILVAIPSIVQHVKAGRLRPLAITGAKRSEALPEVPTVAETLPGFEAVGWYGILAPSNTPTAIVNRLHTVLKRISEAPDIRLAWGAQGIEPLDSTPAQFSSYLRSELAKWRTVIQRAGVKAE